MLKTLRRGVPRRILTKKQELLLLDVALVASILLLIAWLLVCYYSWFKPTTRTLKYNDIDQTFFNFTEDFFEGSVFQKMKSELVGSRLSLVENSLNADNFGTTFGVVISFNLEGLQKLRKKHDMKEMLRFFDAIRVDGTNAFVVNILTALGADHRAPQPRSWFRRKVAAQETPHRRPKAAAGSHLDDTLKIWDWPWYRTSFVSYITTVIYLQVPPDMTGGEYMGHVNSEMVKVTPKENAVLAFRGDAYHHVEQFTSPSDQARVSLVVEQYKIPAEHYGKVWRFWSSARLH